MNGIIDQQTPSRDWTTVPRLPMLHENIQPTSSAKAADPLNDLLEGLEHQLQEQDREFDLSIKTLVRMYMFSDRREVTAFLRSNRTVVPLLIEAFPHFNRSFNGTPLLLEVMAEESESRTINALAMWWGIREEARARLRSFDNSWWLENVGKANGRVVFDYQIEK